MRALAVLVAVALAAACSAPAPRVAAPAPTRAPTTAPATTRPPPSTTTPAPPPPCPAPPAVATERPPPGLVAAVAAGLADGRFGTAAVSASVWVEGFGEVGAREPGLALAPASNQKLLTAAGVLAALPAGHRMATEVRVAGDDLVLVAGGDPTLTTGSLAALAAQVAAAGVAAVPGRLVVDETRYEAARAAPGWQGWQQPAYVGPLSALTVDDNRHRTDAAFVADPATGNGELFRAALAGAGVTVAGPTVVAAAPAGGRVVASLRSPPLADLVATMVRESDNEVAEALTREAGVLLAGEGSTAAGVTALAGVLRDELCLDLAGGWADGSGLSRSDARSAADLVAVVGAARGRPWWPAFRGALAVAGRTGTLAERFVGTAAEGNLRAKTGTIIGGVALTGEVTTAGGRLATFSVVVNGDGAAAAQQAIDDLLVAVAVDAS